MSQEVSIELERVVERWRQLPLDRALSYAGRVRALVQSLADEVARANGLAPQPVPDLGPATLMDQLTVMVHDASATAASSTPVTPTAASSTPVTPTAASSTPVTPTAASSTPVTPTAANSTAANSTLTKALATLRRDLV